MSQQRTPSGKPASRREVVWGFVGAILAAAIGAGATIWSTRILLDQRLPAQEYVYFAVIPASKHQPFTNTPIILQEGDDVQIIVEGEEANWDCGLGPRGPGGNFGEKPDLLLFRSANHCELIGYIREDVYFRVGTYKHFIAPAPGSLYLGANDAETCYIAPDCYTDNKGTLSVRIIVKKVKN